VLLFVSVVELITARLFQLLILYQGIGRRIEQLPSCGDQSLHLITNPPLTQKQQSSYLEKGFGYSMETLGVGWLLNERDWLLNEGIWFLNEGHWLSNEGI
jgi:hypothetical protein